MSGNKSPSGSVSARARLRTECQERGIAYPLAFDKMTGTIVLCEQCACLVTEARFDEAAEAVRSLEQKPRVVARRIPTVVGRGRV
jgi:hypothetical protein